MIAESKKVYLSIIFVLGCVFTIPHSSGSEIDLSYACEKEGAIRYVEVVTDPEFACRVRYTKSSVTSFPWDARYNASYCRPKAIGLVEKLGTSGWACDPAEDVKLILLSQIERYGRYIESQNAAGKTCYFYPSEARFGNLCGDEREEAAIVYTCDVDAGSWNQHLAVFLEIDIEPLTREVGGSGYRQVSSYQINNDRILMETEKVDSTVGADATQYPVEEKAIQCRYSAASEWELFEKK